MLSRNKTIDRYILRNSQILQMLELSERDFKITAIIYITIKIYSKKHKQHKKWRILAEKWRVIKRRQIEILGKK